MFFTFEQILIIHNVFQIITVKQLVLTLLKVYLFNIVIQLTIKLFFAYTVYLLQCCL